MGVAVLRAVAEDVDCTLVAAVDPAAAGSRASDLCGVADLDQLIVRDTDHLDASSTDVFVDFTVASSAMQNAKWCARNDVHLVIGTSGITETHLEELRGMFEGASSNCIVAPNFSLGAVLMMRFAEIAAAWMSSGEIIELHHDRKVDSPSGTSMSTAQRMAQSALNRTPDVRQPFIRPGTQRLSDGASPAGSGVAPKEVIQGARGALGAGGVHIHSVRLPGLLAHQEVVFGSEGETLSIRHDSFDRTSFMPGVLLAVKNIAILPGVTVGIDGLLGI